jgi:hypothetical protein
MFIEQYVSKQCIFSSAEILFFFSPVKWDSQTFGYLLKPVRIVGRNRLLLYPDRRVPDSIWERGGQNKPRALTEQIQYGRRDVGEGSERAAPYKS